jgi:hypothetical protein
MKREGQEIKMFRRFSVSLKPWKLGVIDNLSINEYEKTRKLFPPLCMDCKYYLHPFISPHFPNASCERFNVVMPCMEARFNDNLCGWEGRKFERKERK